MPPPRSRHERDLDVRLGARLRAERELRGMSQASVAKHLGVQFQQVQKYESGTNRIAPSRLIAYARLLNLPPGALLEDTARDCGIPPETAARAQHLARLYAAIPDRKQRRALLHMAESLAAHGTMP